MDGIGRLQATLVIPFPASRRKLLGLFAVKTGKGVDYGIAGRELIRIRYRLE